MKRALLAATAMISSAILSTPALAVDISPDAETQPDQAMMDAYCDANFVTDATHYLNPSHGAIMGSVIPGDLEEVDGTREDIENTRVGDPDSDISYSGLLGTGGALVRIGGSPNMFAAGTYQYKTYSDSFVDQSALFQHRDEYQFTCRYTTVTVTEVPVEDEGEGNPGRGNCVGDPHSQDEIDLHGPGRGATNSNYHSACNRGGVTYEYDYDTVDYDFSFYFTPAAERMLAEEGVASDEPFTEDEGPYTPGDWYGVACISPSGPTKKGNPGEWKKKDNYVGPGTCNTTTFLNAITVFGHVFSDPIPSNSLPQ